MRLFFTFIIVIICVSFATYCVETLWINQIKKPEVIVKTIPKDTIHVSARNGEIKFTGYNQQKTDYLLWLFANVKPMKFHYLDLRSVGREHFEFQYDTFLFNVYHQLYIPYEQPEKWEFNPIIKDGRFFIIDGGMPENRVSDSCLNVIKQYCLNYKRKRNGNH